MFPPVQDGEMGITAQIIYASSLLLTFAIPIAISFAAEIMLGSNQLSNIANFVLEVGTRSILPTVKPAKLVGSWYQDRTTRI